MDQGILLKKGQLHIELSLSFKYPIYAFIREISSDDDRRISLLSALNLLYRSVEKSRSDTYSLSVFF